MSGPKDGLRCTSVADLRAAIAFLSSPEFVARQYGKKVFVAAERPHGLRADAARNPGRRRVVEVRDFDHRSEEANTVARLVERSMRAAVTVHLLVGAKTSRCPQDSIHFQLSGGATISGGRTAKPIAVLTPGLTAYVPGLTQYVVATDPGSCQLVLKVEPATDVEFRTWLAATLKRPDLAGEPVPLRSSPAARVDFIERVGADFAQALASPSILERFLAYRDREAMPRPALTGSPHLVDPRTQRVVVAAARALSPIRQSAHTVYVDCGSTRIVMAAAAAPILQFVQDHDPVVVSAVEDAFADRLPAVPIHQFLQDLAERGVLSFVPPNE